MRAKRDDGPIRWDDLRLLLEVARHGSLLAAGRTVDAATSTLSRRLTRLERQAGTPLLERRSDGARLTEAGRQLAAVAEDLDLRLGARLRDLPAKDRALEGTIRVTAGDGFADVLIGAIAAFVERQRGVAFEVAIETHELDLGRREADLAIRTGARREPSLIYRRLGALPYGLYASPAYLARRGAPRAETDLAKHDVLGFAGPAEKLPIMRWLRARGVARFAFRATSFGAFLVAARAGLGIAALPGPVGDELVRVLPRARPEPLRVALVTHPDARRLPHVRAFADHLVERFTAAAR
jgi:DNA-binding transcriptional LysR family regulator